jgi:hypothetical protein
MPFKTLSEIYIMRGCCYKNIFKLGLLLVINKKVRTSIRYLALHFIQFIKVVTGGACSRVLVNSRKELGH